MIRQVLMSLFLCFLIFRSEAQQGQIRELGQVSQIPFDTVVRAYPTESFLSLYDMAFEYIDNDNSLALDYIKRAERAALLAGDSLWIVKSKRVMAQVLSRLNELTKSVEVAEVASKIASRNHFRKEHCMVLNSLGTSYSLLGREDRALQNFLHTYDLAVALNDSALVSQSLHNVGILYFRLRDFSKALGYLLSALEIGDKIGNVPIYHYKNISLCYANLQDFMKAETFLHAAFDRCTNCSSEQKLELYFTKGYIFFQQERYSEATNWFNISFQLAKEQHDERFLANNILLLSEIYLITGQTASAMSLLREGEAIESRMEHLRDRLYLLKSFFDVNATAENYVQATRYSRKYISLVDSIRDSDLTARLMEVESSYRDRESQAVIQSQNEILNLRARTIDDQRRLNFLITLVSILLLVLVITQVRSIQNRKRLNSMLEQMVKKRTIEIKATTISLFEAQKLQEAFVTRTVADVEASLARIKGLGLVAQSHDDTEDLKLCVSALVRESDSMAKAVTVFTKNIAGLGSA